MILLKGERDHQATATNVNQEGVTSHDMSIQKVFNPDAGTKKSYNRGFPSKAFGLYLGMTMASAAAKAAPCVQPMSSFVKCPKLREYVKDLEAIADERICLSCWCEVDDLADYLTESLSCCSF